jgi:hypothetical protein
MSNRFEEMSWLFSDMIHDMVAPSAVLKELNTVKEFRSGNSSYLAVHRMCLSHLIISLCKFDEIYREYRDERKEMPQAIQVPLDELKREIEKRKIYQFRSKYVGHAFEEIKVDGGKNKNILIPLKEGDKRLFTIVDGDHNKFYDWICPQNISENKGLSVVELIESVRDFCNKKCDVNQPRP